MRSFFLRRKIRISDLKLSYVEIVVCPICGLSFLRVIKSEDSYDQITPVSCPRCNYSFPENDKTLNPSFRNPKKKDKYEKPKT